LFAAHRESRGPVTSVKSDCSSPRSIRSKTTLSQNAVTLPKLSPQLQMLQTGCTDTPSQRDGPFITHPCSPMHHLTDSVIPPPHLTAQPWGMLWQRRQHDSLLFLSPYLLYHNFPRHPSAAHYFHC